MEVPEPVGIGFWVTYESADLAGQRAAILAGLAIALIPLSVLNVVIIDVGTSFGLPGLQDYALGLLVADSPTGTTEAVAGCLRASFVNGPQLS